MRIIRGSIAATVMTMAVSACSGTMPAIGSAPSAASQTAGASTATISAVDRAFAETAWVARDPASEDWIVGRGDHATTHFDLGAGSAEANASAVAYVRRIDGRAWVGIVGLDGQRTEWPLGFDSATLHVEATPLGDVVLVHAGGAGHDDGVLSFDTANGTSTIVVAPGDAANDDQRNVLLLSASGSTAMSTFCGKRDCLVDVIDVAARTARRLEAAFPAVGLTDRYLLGHAENGGAWLALDLASGRMSVLSLDPKAIATRILPVSDTAFVLDVQAEHGDRVMRLDLATDTSRLLYDGAEPSMPGLQLVREPALDGRWVLLAKRASMSELLAEVDGPLTMYALDIDTGALAAEPLYRMPELARA